MLLNLGAMLTHLGSMWANLGAMLVYLEGNVGPFGGLYGLNLKPTLPMSTHVEPKKNEKKDQQNNAVKCMAF